MRASSLQLASHIVASPKETIGARRAGTVVPATGGLAKIEICQLTLAVNCLQCIWMPDDPYRTPGQLVQALLEQRGWSQRVLAVVIDIDESTINKIISGKRSLDAETALLLGDVFGEKPERFLDLQSKYDLAQARIVNRPDPNRATRALLFGDLPVAEMIKRRWLDAEDIRDVASVEKSLKRFFGVRSLGEIEILPHAAKKTAVAGPATPAQLAWLYRVKQIASEMLVSRFSNRAVADVTGGLRSLLTSSENARKVPRAMSECGIRYVIVESLQSAKIDGVCLWLDTQSPVIGMSLRHDRIDNFWFVLRHELEHVLRGHGRNAVMLDAELEKERAGTSDSIPEEERLANAAAAEFCVPQKSMDRFVTLKSPFFSERDLLGFARTVNVHPGLVAGQLQRRTSRYDLFRNHLEKIRSAVLPGSVVDGWGNVAIV